MPLSRNVQFNLNLLSIAQRISAAQYRCAGKQIKQDFQRNLMSPVYLSVAELNVMIRESYKKSLYASHFYMQHCAETFNLKQHAYVANAIRNFLKELARQEMDPKDVKLIEERNIEKYGNPLGPTFEESFEKAKNKILEQKQSSGLEGEDVTDEEIYRYIIKKSLDCSQDFNKKFGTNTATILGSSCGRLSLFKPAEAPRHAEKGELTPTL